MPGKEQNDLLKKKSSSSALTSMTSSNQQQLKQEMFQEVLQKWTHNREKVPCKYKLHILKDIVKLSIHSYRHPSMDGITEAHVVKILLCA